MKKQRSGRLESFFMNAWWEKPSMMANIWAKFTRLSKNLVFHLERKLLTSAEKSSVGVLSSALKKGQQLWNLLIFWLKKSLMNLSFSFWKKTGKKPTVILQVRLPLSPIKCWRKEKFLLFKREFLAFISLNKKLPIHRPKL
jgi:hypothetical protein